MMFLRTHLACFRTVKLSTVGKLSMTNPLFQKDIISISEFSRDHIDHVLETALSLKANP